MSKINNFDVLNRMTEIDDKSLHGYSAADNLMDVNFGKNGWGSIRLAISSDDASNLMSNKNTRAYLLVWDGKRFDEIKKQMEEAEG